MSSKSKQRPREKSSTRIFSEALMVFLWAWVSVAQPDELTINRVSSEILNVVQSLHAKPQRVSLDMINKQLLEEFHVKTDWARRDRG